MTMIDYGLLNESVQYYDSLFFKRVESPWLVSEAVSDMTRPLEAAQYVVSKEGKRKAFVASGEQSFLYMISKGYLAPGKYQTITPCMRNDPFDETHTKYFVKNELISFGPSISDTAIVRKELDDMIAGALTFFRNHAGKSANVVATPQGFDIELNGIEIGSYGIRRSILTTWVYGTGLAEPRFSRLLKAL